MDTDDPERPVIEYDLPPVLKVNHNGRELRCFDAGKDWATLNRVIVDYRHFHMWVPLLQADLINSESYAEQLKLELQATSEKYDTAKSAWEFNREIYLDERTARIRSARSENMLRSVLLGSLAVALVVIAVESVTITVMR